MKDNQDTNERALCQVCKFGGDGAKGCQCPDLSPNIWDYVTPRIETLLEVEAALKSCTQSMLQEHRAAPYVAPAVTALSGKCDYYAPQAAE